MGVSVSEFEGERGGGGEAERGSELDEPNGGRIMTMVLLNTTCMTTGQMGRPA